MVIVRLKLSLKIMCENVVLGNQLVNTWNTSCTIALQWRHNGHDGISNHQPHHCLLNRLFRRTSKKTSKLRVTGLCAGNSPGTGECPAQMASYAENVHIWWRHHGSFVRDDQCIYLTNEQMIKSFDVYIVVNLKRLWNKQPRFWWFKTP